jgi:hypothetical protein
MSVMRTLRGVGVAFELDGTGIWDVLTAHPENARLLARIREHFPISTLRDFRQQHLPGEVLRDLLPAGVWKSSFKFSFVRNPWDMLVSAYHFLGVHTTDPRHQHLHPDVNELIRRCEDFTSYVRLYPMIRSDMSSLITDARGRLLVDFVGRHEHLDEDFAFICRSIGVEAPLLHENTSAHAHYRGYYTDETRAIVERHFARDIERFGYTF